MQIAITNREETIDEMQALCDQADRYWENGRYPQAEQFYQEALTQPGSSISQHPHLATYWHNYASLLQQMGKANKAIHAKMKSLRIHTKSQEQSYRYA